MAKRLKVTFKALRINLNMRQEDAARAIGVSIQTLCSWENYNTFPDLMQLKKICEVYGCELDDIFIPDTLAENESK